MAGGLGSRSGRSVAAVESSGSERDTMELLGKAIWPVGRAHDLGGVFSGRAQRELPRYNGANGMSDPGSCDLLLR